MLPYLWVKGYKMAMGKFISQNRMNPKGPPCLSLATAAVQYETCSLHVHIQTELSAAASPIALSELYH
jgi:hypothetical protein